MTLADTPDRPRERSSGRRPLWIAIVLAVVAVAVTALVVLGGRSRPSSEQRQVRGSVQAATPAQDAAGAVEATPAVGAVGPGAFGGPGSAADGSGPLGVGQTQVAADGGSPRPRRTQPRRAREQSRPATAEQPTYRAIGPTADDEEPAPPQT
jgi:hypothetical protein